MQGRHGAPLLSIGWGRGAAGWSWAASSNAAQPCNGSRGAQPARADPGGASPPSTISSPIGVDARAERLLRPEEDRREENDESEEEEVVESDDEGSEASSVAVLCEPDAGSDEDPTFDPDADGDLEVEAVLRARMGRISISASARKGRKG
ncbi:unnamed protein product [Urochloa humidicola]